MTYRIIRYYLDHPQRRECLGDNLTLEQAQEHCSSPHTSSTTATHPTAVERTQKMGPWFDGYEKEE